ncbi:TonB-dependent receptor [Pseudomonas syringae]|uniref:Outer membrane receptor protein n=1 Tax=Pseudomonas syringae pv. actinidiae TaxID=103796 RepID=A0A2V0QI07_PSESF|nr:TonB-dependent receptor [Pseudomonas syringae]EPM92797.1 TonB-dependent outer membrane heme receptor [Pseudomonas syringae pv. actinidiae ICMP 19070]AQL39186.1 TonB-dependent receptor [Pseudomonas syringae pv. actinidiae ICMP 9853]EGH63420.1 TonB-dependent outer membrane heme receptor [Pseudomonas syringae pv. actinidiae str. M302091]EPM63255.1 TonB-dependent outer membrane heme receptor [Pseudomonas syringae pv. actinidiae ICMP 19103]EPM90250.1 TonB-dependent outer membrane heme receptor [
MSSTFTPAVQNRARLRLSLLTVAVLGASLQAIPAHAAAETNRSVRPAGTYSFSIGQQSLVSALNEFSRITGWQVGVSSELAQNVTSPGALGNLSPAQALDTLLAGSSLSYRNLGNNNVVLERRAAGVMALDQITVSATRQAQEVVTVPSTVSVHSREQLDRNNVNTIRDLVRYEPGVSVGGAGQRAGTTGYNIRGIDGNRIMTQVDGVEVPDSFFIGPYAQTRRNYVDPEIVKRVEILRGPASALYGSSAIGGVVSYYTLDPDDIIKPGKDVGARLKTGYSSADESWLNSATVAGRQGEFDGLLHVSQRNGHETESYGETGGTGLSRTEANPEDARSTNVLAKLGWNYADSSRLALAYEKYKDDRNTNLKSAVGGPFANGIGQGMYQSRESNDTISRERFGIENSVALDSLLADNLKWSLNYQTAKTEQSTQERYVPPSRRDVYRQRETQYQEKQWVFDAQLDKAFSIASTDHVLTYGTTLKQQKVTGLRSGSGTCARVFGTCRVVGADSPSDRLVATSDFPDPTITSYALFAQDQISWNDWTFLPGVRYDHTTLDPKFTSEFLRSVSLTDPAQANDETRTWHRLSPKLGVTYAFSDAYTWYGQYAEGFRTPSAKARYGRFENPTAGYVVEPNPNLEPETSKSYETGLRGRFEAGSFDIAVFYNKYRDFINEDAITPGYSELTFQSNNIKHATMKGAEVKGRINLDSLGAPNGLYSQASVAYVHGRNNDTGEPINSVNPLTGVIGLGYEQKDYGSLLSWTLVKRKTRVDDSSFHSPDGTSSQFKTPGFGILDLAGYYKVSDDVTLNAGLYNLTDKKYWRWDDVRGYDGVGEAGVTAPANLDRLTQPGRNFSVNVVWDI